VNYPFNRLYHYYKLTLSSDPVHSWRSHTYSIVVLAGQVKYGHSRVLLISGMSDEGVIKDNVQQTSQAHICTHCVH